MTERSRYPQIPSTVWWGLRSILNRTPAASIDERSLGIQLNVQETAAKAYVNELKQIGMLNDEGKATSLAQRWRLDDSYEDAVSEIISTAYPLSLVEFAPPGETERQKVVSWFQREGFGVGAANNKAATYLLLSSKTPNEAARISSKSAQTETASRHRAPKRDRISGEAASPERNRLKEVTQGRPKEDVIRHHDAFPLNLNLQIHISADAGSEQIESIFQAMKRYLYDSPDS